MAASITLAAIAFMTNIFTPHQLIAANIDIHECASQ